MDTFSIGPTITPSQSGPVFGPEDIAQMRGAYAKACHEGMMADSTQAQPRQLAKAIIASYKPHIAEGELAAVALILMA